MTRPVVALVTDFGLRDSYVWEMHAAIRVGCPKALIEDVSHLIEPGNIRSASFVLSRAVRTSLPGTIFVAVVDPTVGSARQAVAVRNCGRYFFAPDNGVLSRALDWEDDIAVRLLQGSSGSTLVSHTFHGRDLFAPAAARLAAGQPFESLGPEGTLIDTEPPVPPRRLERGWEGMVIDIDRFGNLVTDLPGDLAGNVVLAGGFTAPCVRYYMERPGAELVSLVGSAGMWEIARPGGSARELTGLDVGATVWLMQDTN